MSTKELAMSALDKVDPFNFKNQGILGKIIGALFLVIVLLLVTNFFVLYQFNETLKDGNAIVQKLNTSVQEFNLTTSDFLNEWRYSIIRPKYRPDKRTVATPDRPELEER